jgi:hypothetical protein
MDSEEAIYRAFQFEGLSLLDAIERLQKIGYEPKDAESVVDEWADALEWGLKTAQGTKP